MKNGESQAVIYVRISSAVCELIKNEVHEVNV